ncbi:MAG: hypothetical protein QM638_14330 [Nocardioides sp.]|uniref:hypothetical protein n=1 Tax=Nocardioides sp. TaxID=35761 RepID=UPI0039E68476
MPVVTITAPPLGAAEPQTVRTVAAAVAEALGLTPDDVFVTTVDARTGTLGIRPAAWPVVVLHGGPRDPAAMRAARLAARAAVATAWDRDEDTVWSQWLVAEPGL